MNALPVIPTPAHVRWREFRVRVLPLIVFAGTVAVVAFLWRDVNNALTLVGAGEGVRCLVSSPQSTVVQELLVMPYQVVQKGDPIAIVRSADPRTRFDLLNSELQLGRLRLQPSLAEENALDYERLRVELLRTRSELAMARVNLERAENDLRRNTPLYQDKLVSEEIYDLSLKTRDLYKAEIEEKTRAAQEIEKRLAGLRPLGEPDQVGSDASLSNLVARLAPLQAAVATSFEAITLTAPISGMVGPLCRQQGEFLLDGEPVVTISSLTCDRIVGYLRQPYPLDPKIGMPVRVTTRNRSRVCFMSEITQVGAQMEIITNALAYLRQGALVDAGLPIVVSIPGHIQIRPGETVDMLIKPPGLQTNGASASGLRAAKRQVSHLQRPSSP